jgi:purine-binding chemotaxis protein CheW
MYALEATLGKSASQLERREEFLQLVSFNVAEEEYGLPILKVQEIIRMQGFTRVPNSPPFVEGVINLRGKVIPVITLRKRFGLDPQPHGRQSRIVVAEVSGAIIGLVVDSVSEVLRISPTSIEPAPRLGNSHQEFVAGVVKLDAGLLILLDVERVMTDTETAQLVSPESAEFPGERGESLAVTRR